MGGWLARGSGCITRTHHHALRVSLRSFVRSLARLVWASTAIVAETCGPYTVLPAVMNEYRVPEMNVQNGVLKVRPQRPRRGTPPPGLRLTQNVLAVRIRFPQSLTFVFEYIAEMGKDYVYAVTPLLEDALIDRDLVHRQTAAVVVKRTFRCAHAPRAARRS